MEKNSISESLGRTYEKLPGMVQFILIVVAFILVFVLVRKMIRKIDTIQKINAANAEADVFAQNGEKLSYPLSEYEDLADEFYVCMDGMGTYNDRAYNVIRALKNNLDFLQFKKAFGFRDGYSLAQWVIGDFNDSRIRDMNNILKSNGIVYNIN